jgi:hypothetical protein
MSEPVAWVNSLDAENWELFSPLDYEKYIKDDKHILNTFFPLYTHPMRELTDEEIKQIFRNKTGYEVDTCPSAILDFSRAILKKANEK